MNKTINGIQLPFTEEWYQNAVSEFTPLQIQTAFDRIKLLEENEQEDLKLTLAMGLHLATPEKHGTATITQMKAGRNARQFKFKLKADNGVNLSPQDSYHNLQDLKATLSKYYPGFTIVDPA